MVPSYPSANGLLVLTDWLLIRRLGWELERRFRGARVRDAGLLADGRFALQLWSRGAGALLCFDLFAPTPVVTVESGELPIAAEPGFVRAAATSLRGTVLHAVRSRRGDRVLRLEFGTRSRFGVVDGYALVAELVPRYGNLVLLKGDVVVAALQEFAPSQNTQRAVQSGHPYEPPPARDVSGTRLLEAADARALAEREPDGDLYVYRRDGTLLQAHLLPLDAFAAGECAREPSLLELFAEMRRTRAVAARESGVSKARRELERRVDRRERRLQGQLTQTQTALARSGERESWREQGEAIYATLHELAPAEQAEAKERAAALFTRYKKASASVEHQERRRAELTAEIEDTAALRWELERAGDGDLDDVTAALDALDPPQRPGQRIARKKRKPQQYATASGSRIYVGRTPLENAELTFTLARPDDLWFHVREQPGAHVVLQRDDRAQPPEQDIAAAASLAALHSKAKSSAKVAVDYTRRKHVRKRPNAAPGLVFYTNAKTIAVEPREPGPADTVPK